MNNFILCLSNISQAATCEKHLENVFIDRSVRVKSHKIKRILGSFHVNINFYQTCSRKVSKLASGCLITFLKKMFDKSLY